MQALAFFTVADSGFFPGAVALINSLRLVGHDDPIHLVDMGLEPAQRALLEREATLIDPTRFLDPMLAQYEAAAEQSAEVIVLVDSDIIVLRSLEELISQARAGRVVAFLDRWHKRFFAKEWAEELGVEQIPRRQYVNAGFLALPGDIAPGLVERIGSTSYRYWQAHSKPVDDGTRSWQAHPFFFSDQDFANAVLMHAVPDDRMLVLDRALAPADGGFDPVRVVDAERLECRDRDGRWPYLLHHWGRSKPWNDRSIWNVYAALLPRLLFADDVAIRLDERELDLRRRPTPAQWWRQLRRRRHPRNPLAESSDMY